MKISFKIKIHPLFILFAFLSIITGMLKNFVIFTFIIVIHELGHILSAIILKIYPKEVIILPFGGITIFNMKLNTSINKEFIIATSGIIFQIIGWILFINKLSNVFDMYNLAILIFNLIPIYPLDGSKILNLFLNKLTSYQNSFFMTMYISFISIFLFIIFTIYKHLSLTWIIILLFLLIKTISEYHNFKYLFNKFLWERFNYSFNFKKEKLIPKINYMKRDYKHLFKIKNMLVNEREILKKKFDFSNKL